MLGFLPLNRVMCRAIFATAFLLFSCASHAALIGLTFQRGDLYTIDESDATWEFRVSTNISGTGNTVQGIGGAAYDSYGTLYATTTGSDASLYTIDPNTGAAELIGDMGRSRVIEGGLAIDANNVGYGLYEYNGNSDLFSIDLGTGATEIVGTLNNSPDYGDFNGLTFRSDGMLISFDATNKTLVTINPLSAAVSVLAAVDITGNRLGGMTSDGSTGYFVDSYDLYSFDLYTGDADFVGAAVPLSALVVAPVPVPAAIWLFGSGLGLLGWMRRKTAI